MIFFIIIPLFNEVARLWLNPGRAGDPGFRSDMAALECVLIWWGFLKFARFCGRASRGERVSEREMLIDWARAPIRAAV